MTSILDWGLKVLRHIFPFYVYNLHIILDDSQPSCNLLVGKRDDSESRCNCNVVHLQTSMIMATSGAGRAFLSRAAV